MSISPAIRVQHFPLSDVHVTGGPFTHANKICAEYLLAVEPDRLLHSFLKHSGLEPKAPIYEGWENLGLAGHSLGHYLTACAQEYAVNQDPRFKERVDYIVGELVACQANRPDGYIAAMPDGDRVWSEIKNGEIRSKGFDLNGLWAPWYTHHKVLAGLIDAYRLTDNQLALKVAEKFAAWAIETTKNLTPDLWQKMLACEYGGMNDSLAELYAITHEAKYLDLSRRFYDHLVLDPLADKQDSLPGKHSNTQIPKVIGLARLYEIEGSNRDRDIAQFFWDTVVHHHTYAIGGNSNHEYLGPPDKRSDRLSTNTCETCNTYNMLKLTRHLFEWEPRAEYFDFYERAHINHILASQNPESGMMSYFVPLSSGAHRTYSTPFDDWTCCHGSGMENHTKHGDSVYFHQGSQKLFVNLFVPTELNWREAGISLKQESDFPYDGRIKLTITDGADADFELAIRHPSWATGEISAEVNGQVAATSSKPSSYFSIIRTWKVGDEVTFILPMELYTEAMPDNPNRVAILYGPVVLAADLGLESDAPSRTPVLITDSKPISDWLRPVAGESLAFLTHGVGRPSDLKLRPFFELYRERYAVYFDQFKEEEWAQQEVAYRLEEQRQLDLEARTVDTMRIGEMQPERDHDLQAEKNDLRDSNGQAFRTPLEGGWFEFTMKVDSSCQNELVMTYWGNDRTKPTFEILVNGQHLATETLPNLKQNQYFDETLALPIEQTQGKDDVRIRVQALPGHAAGALSFARMVRES